MVLNTTYSDLIVSEDTRSCLNGFGNFPTKTGYIYTSITKISVNCLDK